MADLLGCFLVQNLSVLYFLCHLFAFRDRFNARIRSPLLFRTCCHIKLLNFFLESINFVRIVTSTEQELYFRIIATFPGYLLRKM